MLVALNWPNLGFEPLWGCWVCCLIAASLLGQSFALVVVVRGSNRLWHVMSLSVFDLAVLEVACLFAFSL